MKYAVVTGATKGIGRAIAQRLLCEGWYVFANYAHDDQAAEAFVRELPENLRGGAQLVREELSDYAAARRFVAAVLGKTQRIDCLVLNAGETDRTPFAEITPERWEHVVGTNLNCPFYLAQGFGSHIADGGRIIMIGSLCGVYPHAVSPAYGVTKAAVHQLAKELVKVFAPKGVTVNAVVPGFTDTDWQRAKAPEQRKRIEDKTAVHRFARPEEIAQLCWEVINNPFINGAQLVIDGGYCYR